MTLLARLTFAALVIATFGAFFATQRLKRTPPPVNAILATPLFSPNSDGRKDRARVSFTIKKDDDVTVDVVSRDGDRVRRLADGRALKAYRRLSLAWDGRDDDGARGEGRDATATGSRCAARGAPSRCPTPS